MKVLKRIVPEPIRAVARKLVSQVLFTQKLRHSAPILVYQMGKVGSSSVHQSLLKQYNGVVIHTHNFSKNHADPQMRRLYQWAMVEGKPINIISLIREPIGRNISAFFENFERDTGVPYADASFSLEELKTIFLSKYKHNIPLEWFDRNILANFGIDVFSTPFPQSR